MSEENMNQEFRLKKIDEIRNYFIEEINRNELMSKKHKKVCRVLKYVNHSLIVISTVTGCVSISALCSLVEIPIEIASFTIGLKICVITAAFKKYKSIIKEKRKKHNKIVLLAKSWLSNTEVLISNVLINSSISHDEFVFKKSVLKEFNDTKEEIKNSNDK